MYALFITMPITFFFSSNSSFDIIHSCHQIWWFNFNKHSIYWITREHCYSSKVFLYEDLNQTGIFKCMLYLFFFFLSHDSLSFDRIPVEVCFLSLALHYTLRSYVNSFKGTFNCRGIGLASDGSSSALVFGEDNIIISRIFCLCQTGDTPIFSLSKDNPKNVFWPFYISGTLLYSEILRLSLYP